MPTQTTALFRVIEIMKNDFGAYNAGTPTDITETVKWEGDDTTELSEKYPPSEVFGADPLGHAEIEDGMIRYDYRFEQMVDGKWVEIDDPRVRLQNGLTTVEREQEAENRRLFPGDYFDEEDGTLCGICCRDLTDCDC